MFDYSVIIIIFNVAPFYFEKTTDNKSRLFRCRYLAGIFLKMNEGGLLLQKKELTVLARDKIQDLKKKIRIGKLVSAPVSLRASQCLKTFLVRLAVILIHVLKYCIIKCSSRRICPI